MATWQNARWRTRLKRLHLYQYISTLYMGNVVFFCIVMCLEEAATELAVWKIEGYEI